VTNDELLRIADQTRFLANSLRLSQDAYLDIAAALIAAESTEQLRLDMQLLVGCGVDAAKSVAGALDGCCDGLTQISKAVANATKTT